MSGAYLGQLRNQGIDPKFVCTASSSSDAEIRFICFECRNIPRKLFSHKYNVKSYSDQPPVETGRICEKFLCESCAIDKRNGKCGLEGCEFRIIRSGLKQLDHLKHLKFKCPFWKCEAILTFEGFCVHSAEGCHSKGHRENAQNGTSSISTDSSLDTYKAESNYNNNYQLQSFEIDEGTKKVRAMPARPPVTKIDHENLEESIRRLRTQDTFHDRTRENEENRKETYNAVIPPPGRQSLVDRQMHYKKPQRGYENSNDLSRQFLQYSQDSVPEVSGHPKEKHRLMKNDIHRQNIPLPTPTHTPDGFPIPPDIDVPPNAHLVQRLPTERARPSGEEIIVNLTEEKQALEHKLLEERKEWRTEQRRLKNKITVLEKLSTDFKGSDEGLGKVVRDLQAELAQVEREKETAKSKCKRLERVMEKIVGDMTKHAQNAHSQAGNLELTMNKILHAIDYNSK